MVVDGWIVECEKHGIVEEDLKKEEANRVLENHHDLSCGKWAMYRTSLKILKDMKGVETFS